MTLHRLDTAGRLIPQGARPDTRARHHDPARSWRTGHAYRTRSNADRATAHPGHRHNAALRLVGKHMLRDLWHAAGGPQA